MNRADRFRLHYKLLGRLAVPCDLMEWAMWLEQDGGRNRRVAETTVGPLWVSTVFLGLDHNFGEGDPLLFETMIFDGGMTGRLKDSPEVLHCERTPDWAAAEVAHRTAVEAAKVMVEAAQKTLQEAAGRPPGSEAPEAG